MSRRIATLAGSIAALFALAAPTAHAVSGSYGVSAKDGSPVYFTSTARLTSADTDTARDVYKRSGSGTVTLVSGGTENTNVTVPSGGATRPASSDGKIVYFFTPEKLVDADDDIANDVYRSKDGVISLVSGGTADVGWSFEAAASDGSPVFMVTIEALAGSGDSGTAQDVYKRESGQLTLVSGGDPTDGASFEGAASDGSPAFFETSAALVDTDDDEAVDVYKRGSGGPKLISGGTEEDEASFEGAASDGDPVFFATDEALTDADNDTVRDIYKSSGGAISLVSPPGTSTSDAIFEAAASDGSPVFFRTDEQLVDDDDDGVADVYKRSGSGAIRLLTPGTAEENAFFRGAANDGDPLYFVTEETLTPADDTDGGFEDIYKSSGGVISLVSGTSDNGTSNLPSFRALAPDGSPAIFETAESLVGAADADGALDVYKRGSGAPSLLSAGTASVQALVEGDSFEGPVYSNDVHYFADGSPVFFTTAEQLVGADEDSDTDLYQRLGSVITLISAGPTSTTIP